MDTIFALIYLKGAQPPDRAGTGAEDRYYRLNAPRSRRIGAPLAALATIGFIVLTLDIISR